MRSKKAETKQISGNSLTKVKKVEKNAESRKKTPSKNVPTTESTATTSDKNDTNDSKKSNATVRKAKPVKKSATTIDDTKTTATAQKKAQTNKSGGKKQQLNTPSKSKPSSLISSEEKVNKINSIVKSSKELKNLDIELTAFDYFLQSDIETESGESIIKASISEIVKTKSRSTASNQLFSAGNSTVSSNATSKTTTPPVSKPIAIKSSTTASVAKQTSADGKTEKTAKTKPTTSASKVSEEKSAKQPLAKKKNLNSNKKVEETAAQKTENVKTIIEKKKVLTKKVKETAAKEAVSKDNAGKDTVEKHATNTAIGSKETTAKDVTVAETSNNKKNEKKSGKATKSPKDPAKATTKANTKTGSKKSSTTATASEITTTEITTISSVDESKLKPTAETDTACSIKAAKELTCLNASSNSGELTVPVKKSTTKKSAKATESKTTATDKNSSVKDTKESVTANVASSKSEPAASAKKSTTKKSPKDVEAKPTPKQKASVAKVTTSSNPTLSSATPDSITMTINEVIKLYTEMSSDNESPIKDETPTVSFESTDPKVSKAVKSKSVKTVKAKDNGKVKKATNKNEIEKSIKKKLKNPVKANVITKAVKAMVEVKNAKDTKKKPVKEKTSKAEKKQATPESNTSTNEKNLCKSLSLDVIKAPESKAIVVKPLDEKPVATSLSDVKPVDLVLASAKPPNGKQIESVDTKAEDVKQIDAKPAKKPKANPNKEIKLRKTSPSKKPSPASTTPAKKPSATKISSDKTPKPKKGKDNKDEKDSKIEKIENKPETKVENKSAKPIAPEYSAVQEPVKKSPAKKAKISVRSLETMTTAPKLKEVSAEITEKEDEQLSDDDDDDDDLSLNKLKASMAKSKQASSEKPLEPVSLFERHETNISASAANETNVTKSITSTPITKKTQTRKPKQPIALSKNDETSTVEKDNKATGSKTSVQCADIYEFNEPSITNDSVVKSKSKENPKKNNAIVKKKLVGVQKKKSDALQTKKTKEKAEQIKSLLKDSADKKLEKPIPKVKPEKKLVKKETMKKEAAKPKAKPIASTKMEKHHDSDTSSDESPSDSTYTDGEEQREQKRYSKKRAKIKEKSSSDEGNTDSDNSDSDDSDRDRESNRRKVAAKNRRMKLYGFYSGPKRHRMASLNASAKVQCLYENESRTAQELGFVKEPRIVPKEQTKVEKLETNETPDKDSEKEEKNKKQTEKKAAPTASKSIVKQEKEDGSSRTLRKNPGLRGAGTLWEMEESSMDESKSSESDSSCGQNGKARDKKKTPTKRPAASKTKSSTDSESPAANKKTNPKTPIKPKAVKATKLATATSNQPEVKDVVVHKRMASLNASAMLAAAYEVERHIDRCEAKYNSATNDSDAPSPKRVKDIKNEDREEKDAKPVSTNVVIVQDTDVTITGVYVNSSLGSSQEAYCKMQYRVQSSVMEERLLQTSAQDPPKSYTPLGALSGMVPPGPEGVDPMQPQSSGIPSSSSQNIPMQSPNDCDTSFMYSSMYRQQPHPPVPPPSIHPISSAFCPFPSQTQHDPMGYYQPAGPLISSHFVGPQNLTKPSSSLLESDPRGIQSQQSSSNADPPESEILVSAGADDELQRQQHTFRYPPAQQQPALPLPIPVPGPYARNMHQLHCPTYPPTYYGPYSQHPQEICYPPYQSPYYPPKVYPGPYRRYLPGSPAYYQPPPTSMYESVQSPSSGHIQTAPPTLPPPPNAPPLASGNGPPQHIDHYAYCSGFPSGGQCYSRGMQPPYMDSSPYPPNCPCPMQSCPKNVHTGPLIGSKTSKGPGQTNSHLIASHPNDPDTNSTASLKLPSVAADAASCITSDTAHIFVKPEFNEDHRIDVMNASNATSQTGINTACGGIYLSGQNDHEKVGFAPLYFPNYSLNPKVLEKPEQPVSPARGSTGLPTSPTLQASGIDENPNHPHQTSTASYQPTIGRRARVGKSMAREMMMQPHLPGPNKHDDPKTTFDDDKVRDCSSITMRQAFFSNINENNENIPTALIKKENVKTEKEDIEMSTSEKVEELKIPIHRSKERSPSLIRSCSANDDVEISMKRRRDAEEIINLDESTLEVITPNLKRQKILEIRQNSARISPKRSYKNLIKPTEPKPYLCKAQRKKLLPKNLKRLLKSNESADKRTNTSDLTKKPKSKKPRGKLSLLGSRILNQSDADQSSSNQSLVSTDNNYSKSKDITVPLVNVPAKETDAKELTVEKPMETNKQSESTISEFNERNNKCQNSATTKKAYKSSKEAPITNVTEYKSKSPNKSIPKLIYKELDADSDDETSHIKLPRTSHPIKSNPKGSAKSKPSMAKLNCETIAANNNNNCLLFDKNTCNNNDKDLIESELLLDGISKTVKLAPNKRSKSRGSKFSNKKRHRIRCMPEITEAIMPRKTVSSPRWSNGWNWEGEPFHGKVFLNSDEHQVLRTRYPAMKHETGDTIQPGDCVLLRAGSKKNELPYVAKVASLWENPEDGEMMMSLFWYYRPEHTEQGRQSTDCPDEVFASKHLDHNSVACIEDKCYVLTFNEYCRYRKAIKSIEEGVEMVPSIVPLLNEQIDREVPLNTSSELILFCRRVYDFRLKRLIKNPS